MRISDWSSDVCSSDLSGLPSLAYSTHPSNDRSRQALPPNSFGWRPCLREMKLSASLSPIAPSRAWIHRSEERRVGKECVSTCSSRWSPYHSKHKSNNTKHNSAISLIHTNNITQH